MTQLRDRNYEEAEKTLGKIAAIDPTSELLKKYANVLPTAIKLKQAESPDVSSDESDSDEDSDKEGKKEGDESKKKEGEDGKSSEEEKSEEDEEEEEEGEEIESEAKTKAETPSEVSKNPGTASSVPSSSSCSVHNKQ